MSRILSNVELDESTSPYRWYLVRARAGQHRRAKSEIRRAGLRAVIIMSKIERLHHRHGYKLVKRLPAFEGYLFLRMPRAMHDSWDRLRGCNAVAGVMTTITTAGNEVPLAIKWRVVARLLDKQRRGGFDFTDEGRRRRGEIVKSKTDKLRDIFRPGRRVRVREGAFVSFDGQVEAVGSHGEIDILISIFGRETPVRFTDAQALAIADPGKDEP